MPSVYVCACVRVCACPPDAKYTLCASSAGFAYTKFPPAEVMSPSERRLLWFCDNETPLFNGIAMGKKNPRPVCFLCLSLSHSSLSCSQDCAHTFFPSALCLWSQLSPSIPFYSVHPPPIQPLSLPVPLLCFSFNVIFIQPDTCHMKVFQSLCDNNSNAFAAGTSSPPLAGRECG